LPARLSSYGVVVEFFAFCRPVLFPVGVFEDFLCCFEAFGHFVLRLFGGSIVVIGGAVDGLMDGPDFPFFFEGDWVVHI
jgi:hypothetical protein